MPNSYVITKDLPQSLKAFERDLLTPFDSIEVLHRGFLNNELAFIALSRIENDVYCIPHLAIIPHHPNKEVVASFLDYFETEAIRNAASGLLIIYPGNDPFETLFDSLIKERGWKPPENYAIRCTFELKSFSPPWLYHPYKVPKEYEIFLWSKAKESDKNRANQLEASGIVPSSLFLAKHNPNPLNSLGIRYRNALIGWLLVEKIGKETLSYNAFWVDPAHRTVGPTMEMLKQSILIQKRQSDLYPFAEAKANYLLVNHRWIRFFKRSLQPYSKATFHLYRAFKAF